MLVLRPRTASVDMTEPTSGRLYSSSIVSSHQAISSTSTSFLVKDE
jgi:hypothetical protein